ncbi:CHAT domain-containing protein [Nakamurella sp. YIM 132087]|uniref:CHAT domain-containing protein n=1 Tax=Nakamurella alba TaxID=2665158 RepID=A0A7K1FNA5_9ACTN|nr:CHAT domain-containing tetratricopeptide repeat protein [Nakamurella alba]MTD14264.1 CHAT domain-containing protein [Nakamurella alba]
MDLLSDARAAVDAAQSDPREALRLATAVLDHAADTAGAGTGPTSTAGRDTAGPAPIGPPAVAAATAHWAIGLARRELGDLGTAETSLRQAVDLASAAGATALVASVRSSLALVRTYQGAPEDGLAELDLAEPHLDGPELARARMQRGLILQRLGRLDEALERYAAALPVLEQAGDRLAEVRLRVNRGVALVYRNELPAADLDLVRARELAIGLGQGLQVAACSHNLGFLYGRHGDVPRSLGWFDRAQQEYTDAGAGGGATAVLLADRAEVLSGAGLVDEALAVSREALARLSDGGNDVEIAEAQLTLARNARSAGARAEGAELARRAATSFALLGRDSWVAHARWIEADCTAVDGADGLPATVDATVVAAAGIADLAGALDRAGWAADAVSALLLAAGTARSAGDITVADGYLERAAAARTDAAAATRITGWYAEARRRLHLGDRSGAARAARDGLRTVTAVRSTLVAGDLRAHVSLLGQQLADLLVALALRHGGPEEVFRAAETWRAASLLAPVRPPADPELARRLAALRAAVAELRPDAPAAAVAVQRQEREIRDLVRSTPATPAARTAGTGDAGSVDPAAVRDALGERILLEWVQHDGRLHLLQIAAGRTHLAAVGHVAEIRELVADLRFQLHRLARGVGSERSLAAAEAGLDRSARLLSGLLLGPAAADLPASSAVPLPGYCVPLPPGGELVLIPTGDLHGVPWAALPWLRERSHVVAPSARTWVAAASRHGRPGRGGRTVLVAGPDLPGAPDEIGDISGLLPDAVVLAGADAGVGAVLEAIGDRRTTVVHVAAHGTFRTDNPLFSALQLADGPLTVYDLQALERVPPVLVLAACDTAGVAVRPGDEPEGLATALLSAGAGTVIAPSVPVPDDATALLMPALHRHLAAGADPARALRLARTQSGDGGPRELAARSSFVALGG